MKLKYFKYKLFFIIYNKKDDHKNNKFNDIISNS